jgi:hypothetical protein
MKEKAIRKQKKKLENIQTTKINNMPQDKRKLTEAEVGMAKSLTKLKTPMTKKEELQAVVQRAKLLKENQRLNNGAKKGFVIVGKDMTKVPSIAKRMMEKKAANMMSKKSMNEPTSTKRVVGVFSIKK